MNIYKKPVIAFLAFLLIQLAVSVIVTVPYSIYSAAKQMGAGGTVDPEAMAAELAPLISIALLISSLVSIWVMIQPMKMMDIKENLNTRGLKEGWWVVPVSVLGIISLNVFNQLLDLPNLIETQMNGMINSVLGTLAIAIVGPIAEEVAFRGAIQGWMHKNGVSPLRAILVASILFGVMHMNPAQAPFAAMVGMILGVVYWKTGSLILPCICHVINNSTACLLTQLGTEDESFIDALGGTIPAVAISTVIIASCAWLLYKWNPAKTA